MNQLKFVVLPRMSATRAHIPEKNEKFFLTLNRLIYNG